MGSIGRATAAAVLVLVAFVSAGAQESEAARRAYFGAVAEYFQLPSSEISILGDWRLPADEIPVVLFVARRAGVSPEALAALRRSGSGWAELATRYRVEPGAFHLPLPEDVSAGRLAGAYEQFRGTPTGRWQQIRLSDADIVSLVNVRLMSEVLDLSVGDILDAAGSTGSFVALYTELLRNDQLR